MGNHDTGRAMGRIAEAIIKREKVTTKKRALEVLDEICEPYRGSDAEFEADNQDDQDEYVYYNDPAGPLGGLICTAFSKLTVDEWKAKWAASLAADDEKAQNDWSFGPLEKFRKRYDIC